MTLDTLLILAEYFSHRKEVEFAILLSEDSPPGGMSLAVSFSEATLLSKSAGVREFEISKELTCLMGGKPMAVHSVNYMDGFTGSGLYKSAHPVYCRNGYAYEEFMKKISGQSGENDGLKNGFWNSGVRWVH